MLKGGVIMDVTTPEEARIAGKCLWSLQTPQCLAPLCLSVDANAAISLRLADG
jgi:hypothetical protein